MARRSLSPLQQELLLENGNIFAIPAKKAPGEHVPIQRVDNTPLPISEYVPILNKTAEWQDELAYTVMWDLCHGQDVEESHPLRKYKLSFLRIKTGYMILVESFGLWAWDVYTIHSGFQSKGKEGARRMLARHCYYGDEIRTLIMRYMKSDDENFLNLPDAPSIHDPHPWTMEHGASIQRTPKLIDPHCQCAICLDDEKYPRRKMNS